MSPCEDVDPDARPTSAELVALLRAAPPREMIADQRYWDWRSQVEALLARVEASPDD